MRTLIYKPNRDTPMFIGHTIRQRVEELSTAQAHKFIATEMLHSGVAQALRASSQLIAGVAETENCWQDLSKTQALRAGYADQLLLVKARRSGPTFW